MKLKTLSNNEQIDFDLIYPPETRLYVGKGKDDYDPDDDENIYNAYDVFYITSKYKNYKYDYKIELWKEAGLDQQSYIKLNSARIINKEDIYEELYKDELAGIL